jgi:hypothetical protein
VKRARELIYTAERQASRDVSLAGLRLKPGSSQFKAFVACAYNKAFCCAGLVSVLLLFILICLNSFAGIKIK